MAHPLEGRLSLAGRPELADIEVAGQQLEERLMATDLVLLGETHDNPQHHRLQARVLSLLLERGARPALVFEMMDSDQWRPRPREGRTPAPGARAQC